MQIQDVILTFGSLILWVSLIPTVIGKGKPQIVTSVVTGIVLAVFAGVYVSLDLLISTFVTILTSLTWFILAVQRHRQ